MTSRKMSSGELNVKHPDGVIIIMIINFSTLPLQYYSQHHCVRKHQMSQFSALYNCSILPLYGTLDLVKVITSPLLEASSTATAGSAPCLREVEDAENNADDEGDVTEVPRLSSRLPGGTYTDRDLLHSLL